MYGPCCCFWMLEPMWRKSHILKITDVIVSSLKHTIVWVFLILFVLQAVAGLSLCKCGIKINLLKRVETCFTYTVLHSEQLTSVLGQAHVPPLWVQAWLPFKVNWSKTKPFSLPNFGVLTLQNSHECTPVDIAFSCFSSEPYMLFYCFCTAVQHLRQISLRAHQAVFSFRSFCLSSDLMVIKIKRWFLGGNKSERVKPESACEPQHFNTSKVTISFCF